MNAQKKCAGLQLVVAENHEAMSRLAANLISQEIMRDPGLLFCAATGSTPTGTYQRLAAEYAKDPAPFKQVRVLKLDEWGGLDMNHPATCEAYLQKHLLAPLAIARERYFGCTSRPADPEAECRTMDRVMEIEGPIDLCLLGLGLNGHLGLNEPEDYVSPGWHVSELSRESLDHAMLRDTGAIPRFGITLGMSGLLQSKQILLLVSGSQKKGVLKRLFEENITTHFPASFLRLHPRVTVLSDADAADSLTETAS